MYLKDIWPSSAEIADYIRTYVTADMFTARYADVFKGDGVGRRSAAPKRARPTNGTWASTYVQNPPYFEGLTPGAPPALTDIENARVLGLFLDSITTDHISPAGSIEKTGPAGKYLIEHSVPVAIQFLRRAARQS